MNEDVPSPENSTGSQAPDGAITRELLITNKRGLHARASAKFVQTVERFNADVWVTRGGETVGGTSIMGLMMLSAGPGTASSSPPLARRPKRQLPPSANSSRASSTKKAPERPNPDRADKAMAGVTG